MKIKSVKRQRKCLNTVEKNFLRLGQCMFLLTFSWNTDSFEQIALYIYERIHCSVFWSRAIKNSCPDVTWRMIVAILLLIWEELYYVQRPIDRSACKHQLPWQRRCITMVNVQTRENNPYFYLYFRVKYFRMNITRWSRILNIVSHLQFSP